MSRQDPCPSPAAAASSGVSPPTTDRPPRNRNLRPIFWDALSTARARGIVARRLITKPNVFLINVVLPAAALPDTIAYLEKILGQPLPFRASSSPGQFGTLAELARDATFREWIRNPPLVLQPMEDETPTTQDVAELGLGGNVGDSVGSQITGSVGAAAGGAAATAAVGVAAVALTHAALAATAVSGVAGLLGDRGARSFYNAVTYSTWVSRG